MKDRLQFVHCDTLFKTNIEAKEYVESGDLISYNRPALYAEPMVLKYGDEKNPNILLAIGSVGDGKTPTKENKVFFIDFADIEKSIEEIKGQVEEGNLNLEAVKEQISKIIKSCGFNENGEYVPNQEDNNIKTATSLNEADELLSKAIDDNYEALTSEINAIKNQITKLENFKVSDSNTIAHNLVKEESGSTLTSNVKIADFRTVSGCNINNIIIEQNDGIFANVRLKYDDTENKLIFGVNDDVKEISLPKENHVVSGEYDTKTESLVLTFKEPVDGESKTLSIDLSRLIGEWAVLGENTDTPVILTKTPVKSDDILHGAESYQDILKADVRIPSSEYKPYNILQKTEDNRYLYVDGIADNIKYLKNGKVITVKQALDEVDCNVSTHDGNIIYRKEDGIFANVELEYITARNVLKFTKTNKDGDVDIQELTLNNITFLEKIYYDSLTEELVILYKDATGETKELRVPVSSLFEEWEVDNTNHTVTLTKSEHQTAGKDKLSADVNIASTADNILRVVNHGLHVKGTSDNIKHNGSTVKDALDLLNGAEDTEGSVRNLIKKESDERKESDESILTKVLANETAISENKSAINAEVSRATSEEKRIEDKFDAAISKQGTVNTQITSAIEKLQSDLNSEVSRSTEKDSQFERDLSTEITRAKGEEQRIEGIVNNLKESSESKDDELSASISSLEGKLTAEQEARISGDAALDGKILAEQEARISGDTALDSKILAEQEARTSGDAALDGKILAESDRAKEAENTISKDLALLGEKVTANTNAISDANGNISKLESKLDSEIQRASSAEQANASAIASETATRISEISRVEAITTDNTRKIEAEVERATKEEGLLLEKVNTNTSEISGLKESLDQKAKDLSCIAENTDNITLSKESNAPYDGYKLSGRVNISSLAGNIINKTGALFASVDIQYNSAKNTLTLVTSNNEPKVVQLGSGSIIKSISYDSENKRLVVVYINAEQQEETIYVPVSDLYNEWVVEDRDDSVIKLTKVKGEGGEPDVLKADLKLATPESGNLLQNTNGNLYASNKALDIKLSDEKKTSVEAAIIDLNHRIVGLEGDVADNTELVQELEKTVNEHTTSIKNNSDRIDSLIIDNNQNKLDIIEIKGDIVEINNDIDTINGRLDGIDANIDEIEQNIEDLQSKTNITTEDTSTAHLTFTHTTNSSTLKADVKVSSEAKNLIKVKDDGLHVLEDYDFGTY